MSRDYLFMIIGGLALLIAFAAIYEVYTVSNKIQSSTGQINVPDYSADLASIKSKVDSLSSQVSTISSNLAVLNSVNNNLTDIQKKLANLQNTNTQGTQTGSSSLAILLDKSSYLQTDTVNIVAVGANPQKAVEIQLLDNSGFIVLHKQVFSDSTGRVAYGLQLSSALPAGNYKIQVISDQQTSSQPLTIGSSSGTTSSLFTAQTDKAVYNTGDLIQVSGSGQAGTSITGVLTSPSGKTYSSTTTIQSGGFYSMIFSPGQPYETGNWFITLTNQALTKTLSINIGSGNSSTSYTFTALADNSVYNRGANIFISGTGQPNTSVTAVLTGPNVQSYTTTGTINTNGGYTLIFSTLSSYPVGIYTLMVTNLSQSKSLTITLQ